MIMIIHVCSNIVYSYIVSLIISIMSYYYDVRNAHKVLTPRPSAWSGEVL